MIRKILIGFVLATLAILLLLWLVTGGPRKVADSARSITNSFNLLFWKSTSTSQFRLPWQPAELTLGAIPEMSDSSIYESEQRTPEEELRASQEEYDAIQKEVEEAKTFGEPSPYRGTVYIRQGAAADGPVANEYVEIEAAFNNTAPVGIAGWSLQSAVTGLRAYIPRAAEVFVLGDVNQQKDTYLNPGAAAVAASGVSPVGTSFRENTCTGYLSGLQTFAPSLSHNCPPPADSLPLTPDNLKAYGDSCYDFVQTLPRCYFPSTAPENISPACRIFLANNLSYNGCVANYRYKTDFLRDSWRIYLNAGGELWRNTHDIIRLLDAEGRTVDVVSY